MSNTTYQGVAIKAGSATSKAALNKAGDAASAQVITLRMPSYCRVTPAMIMVPDRTREKVLAKFAEYGAFFDAPRYWYLPDYVTKEGKKGGGCSTAIHVARDKDGTFLITAPLSDFTGTRMLPRAIALKADETKAKAKRSSKTKAKAAPQASEPTVTAPSE